jgi:hypothetical protein
MGSNKTKGLKQDRQNQLRSILFKPFGFIVPQVTLADFVYPV